MTNRMEKCFYCKKDLTKENEKIHGYHQECYTRYYKESLRRETHEI